MDWRTWFQDNFNTFILLALYGSMLAVVVHMAYHQSENTQLNWIREGAGTVLGCLLGFIQGRSSVKGKASATVVGPSGNGGSAGNGGDGGEVKTTVTSGS